jgi:YbgC/YbaW family acyl-CoA thioester hydrolase
VILALRLPWTALRARRRPEFGPDGVSILRLRVRYTDLDLYGHVNNGRFLTLMDLGRTDFAVRSGLARTFRAKRWQAVAGGATIRFRRSLLPFRKYEMHTSLAGADGRWWFFDQTLFHNGKMAATAWVKVAVLEDGKPVERDTVLAALGWPEAEQPTLPDGLLAWQATERS